MFDSLLGGELPLPVKFLLAFIIVLGLIVAATWLIRRFAGTRLGTSSTRGRQPRLAVIDAASVDARRRLVLIRRDNVEHLVLIGGPTDIVIEQNIVRAVPVAPPRDAAPARGHAPDASSRPLELPPRSEPAPRPEATWAAEPTPARTARASRQTGEEPQWQGEPTGRGTRQAEPGWTSEPTPRPPRQGEPAKAPQVDLPTRPLPEPVTAALRAAAPAEPPRTPAARPAAPKPSESEAPVEMRQSPPTADVNLADMAQRLEAALRRPARPVEARDTAGRPEPKARPSGEPRAPAAPTSREPSPAEPAPPSQTPEPPQATAPEATPEPPKPAEPPAEAKPASAKSVFDSLEEEMANLLGRSQSKS